MPLIDMPLEKLQAYRGRNPCPDDHDAYWDRALAEMRAIDPQVEMTPADFQAPFAECFDLYFTGAKGARVYAKLLRPTDQTEPGPGVVNFHGYTGRSGPWCDSLGMVAAGFTVASLDCRGQGGRSQDVGGVDGTTHHGHIIRGLNDDDPDNLLFRQIFLDAAQLAGIVIDMDTVDGERVAAYGRSQGGGLALACAALEPRIKRAAPAFPFLCDYQRVWEMDLAAHAYTELKTFFRHFDPTHAREKHWFTKLGYIDVQHLAPRIEAQVLMAVGLMDNVCPPSTQYAAFNKIRSKKDSVIYPDFGHESLPGWNDREFGFVTGI